MCHVKVVEEMEIDDGVKSSIMTRNKGYALPSYRPYTPIGESTNRKFFIVSPFIKKFATSPARLTFISG